MHEAWSSRMNNGICVGKRLVYRVEMDGRDGRRKLFALIDCMDGYEQGVGTGWRRNRESFQVVVDVMDGSVVWISKNSGKWCGAELATVSGFSHFSFS